MMAAGGAFVLISRHVGSSQIASLIVRTGDKLLQPGFDPASDKGDLRQQMGQLRNPLFVSQGMCVFLTTPDEELE